VRPEVDDERKYYREHKQLRDGISREEGRTAENQDESPDNSYPGKN
jgi:hypothetical protein